MSEPARRGYRTWAIAVLVLGVVALEEFWILALAPTAVYFDRDNQPFSPSQLATLVAAVGASVGGPALVTIASGVAAWRGRPSAASIWAIVVGALASIGFWISMGVLFEERLGPNQNPTPGYDASRAAILAAHIFVLTSALVWMQSTKRTKIPH